jgi:glycosyltransferase involved in cell wall biosynthesis
MKLRAWVPKLSQAELTYPAIDSISSEAHRPFWSVMIPTYNRRDYLERVLRSIISQDPGPEEMQIEVVDDCSPDVDMQEVINELAPGRISLYRQPQNVGLSLNWNTCIQRARGRYIHIMHDDDMVMPTFYSEYRRFLEQEPQTVLLFSRAVAVGEHDEWLSLMEPPPAWDPAQRSGILENALCELVKRDFIVCPTAVVARSAYEQVGGFALNQFYTLDWEMWLRLAAFGQVGYIHEPLFQYRVHGDTETYRLAVTGRNIEEIVGTAERGVKMLPESVQHDARTKALRNAADDAIYLRMRLHQKRKYGAGLYYALWAFKLQPSARNLTLILKSALRAALSWLMNRSPSNQRNGTN